MKERDFQHIVIEKIRKRFPEAIILKNDANYLQGYPDLTIHKNGRYAIIECKRSKDETHQPNQDYYIDKANNDGGYGAFVYPDNLDIVLEDLDNVFNPISYCGSIRTKNNSWR